MRGLVGHKKLLTREVIVDDGRRGRSGRRDHDGRLHDRRWGNGDQKSLAVEWAPVGAKKCLVARVEILMGENEPKMTSFLVEDLDEVLELSD